MSLISPKVETPNVSPAPQSAPARPPMAPQNSAQPQIQSQAQPQVAGQPVKRPVAPAAQGQPMMQRRPVVSGGQPQPMMQRRPVMPMGPSGVQMGGSRSMTPEQHMQKIMADLAEAAKKPDPIPCEHLQKINDEPFSDVYITPDRKCYTWAAKSDAGLKVVDFTDYPEFLRQIEDAFDGKNRSYLLTYEGRHYRVERTIADGGPQYCARKMPVTVPDLKKLGLPENLYKYLLSLSGRSGLILLAGPTGSGKSTTISALLKEYLSQKGGYCFTIEDPIELPLDGVYVTPTGELGLCKQTTPPDGLWQEGIKSALRSKPRYIYLGEIRDPHVASEALRAATSGHLVLSTIHANNVSDSINSLVKYAASSGISEDMAYELVANGFLGCLHQILTGAPKKISVTYVFANPDLSAGCQVRSMFRNGKLNLSTIMEQQKIKMDKAMPLF